MQIDARKIESELQELAGQTRIKVKLNNHLPVACSSRETDKGYSITFNPKRYRSPRKLEEHIQGLREDMVWGN